MIFGSYFSEKQMYVASSLQALKSVKVNRAASERLVPGLVIPDHWEPSEMPLTYVLRRFREVRPAQCSQRTRARGIVRAFEKRQEDCVRVA